MQIRIKQNKLSIFSNTYRVFRDGEVLFKLTRINFIPIGFFSIKDGKTKEKIGQIRNKVLSLRGNAKISIPNGNYHFTQKSIESNFYKCENLSDKNDLIFIERYKGFNGAIFKNELQIGFWKKNQFVVLDGDNYELKLSADVDLALISAMMVLVDYYRFSLIIGGDIGFEIGNSGNEVPKQIKYWKPKDEDKSLN